MASYLVKPCKALRSYMAQLTLSGGSTCAPGDQHKSLPRPLRELGLLVRVDHENGVGIGL
jgi:hypothetical protein